MEQATLTESKSVFGCVGSTIRLRSGIYLDLLDPKPDQITLADIAGGLSKICRFGGQVDQFYSVAEHSFWCCTQADIDRAPNHVLKSALLHDAAEAYLGDMVKPLKNLLPEYSRMEHAFEACIERRFGVTLNDPLVKEIDKGMLIHERRKLFSRDSVKWTGEDSVRQITVPGPVPWTPGQAYSLFIAEAKRLGLN